MATFHHRVHRVRSLVTALGFALTLVIPTVEAVQAHPALGGRSDQAYIVPAAKCVSPPANFDPATASNDQLALYGLPHRPQGDVATISRWVAHLRHAKNRSCSAQTSGRAHTSVPSQITTATTTYSTTPNWSGYVATLGSFSIVEGDWNVPCYGSTSAPGSKALSWVGIGGYNSSTLWQGGTTEDPGDGYHFWWEYVPNVKSYQVWTSPTLRCGDAVYAETDWNVSVANQSYVVLVDETQNQYVSMTYNARPNQTTAEWVDERPLCSDIFGTTDYYGLSNFGTVYWSQADANYGTGYHAVAWYNPANVEMRDNTYPNQIDAIASNLGSDGQSWSDYFNSPGNGTC